MARATPHGQRERPFVLEHEVSQHVLHQRLPVQHATRMPRAPRVVQRQRDGGALPGGGANHAVEAGHSDHLDDGTHAAAFLSTIQAKPAQLRLTARVRRVAHLALQAQHLQRVLAAVQPARQQEATESARCMGKHQKDVAHRRRDEVFVADEFVYARTTGPAPAGYARARGGAHVRPALLSVIAMPTVMPPF